MLMRENSKAVTMHQTGSKTVLGRSSLEPYFVYDEHTLGFETELRFFDGLHLDKIDFLEVPNTRSTSQRVQEFIESKWQETLRETKGKAFSSPLPRYEGSTFNMESGRLAISWSRDEYKNHSALRKSPLPKEFQANLWTINVVPVTTDGKIPIAMRNPETTDQGRIEHMAPVGFVNLQTTENGTPERLEDAAARTLRRDLIIPGYEKELPYDPNELRLMGVVYNHLHNFDYTASVFMRLDKTSAEIQHGPKYVGLRWVDRSQETLTKELAKLAFAQGDNSGHLRGDIALLIGHLYGSKAYQTALQEAVLDVTTAHLNR
jgi:hypothetical protein